MHMTRNVTDVAGDLLTKSWQQLTVSIDLTTSYFSSFTLTAYPCFLRLQTTKGKESLGSMARMNGP